MNPTIAFWVLPAGAAVYAILGCVLMYRRDARLGSNAELIMFTLAAWVLGAAMEMAATSRNVALLGTSLTFACGALIPALGLHTATQFTRRSLPRFWLRLLYLFPALSLAVLLNPALRPLIWNFDITITPSGNLLSLEYGWWFYFVHVPYAYIAAFSAVAVLGVYTRRQAPMNWPYTVAFIACALVPMVGSLLHVSGVWLGYTSPTAILIALIAPALAWLILRRGVLLIDRLEHRALFEQMSDAVIVLAPTRHVLAINAAAASLFDIGSADVQGRELDRLLPQISVLIDDLVETGESRQITLGERHLSLRVSLVSRARSDYQVALLICHDVTSEQTAMRQLRLNEELLRSLIHHSSNAILRLRRSGDDFEIVVANRAAAALLGNPVERIVGNRIGRIIEGLPRSTLLDKRLMLPKLNDAMSRGVSHEFELESMRDGETRHYRILLDPVGSDIGVTCVDITAERAEQTKLESEALIDPLTGVLNRRGFEQSASRCLAELADDASGALLFIDLDNFKRVNDIHGHDVGDLVLQITSQRLRETLRDIDVVGRHGGDEFVALVPDVKDLDVEALRQRVKRELAAPFAVGDVSLNCSASVGLARFPGDAVTLTSLMRAADVAMYAEKATSNGAISGTFRRLRIADTGNH